jgi:hypothetical protein
MAKIKEAAGRPMRKKYGMCIIGAEYRFVCLYCEVIQKIKNGSNNLHVCKKNLEECGRQEQIDKQKKTRAETPRKYYHSMTALRRRNGIKIKKDFLHLCGSRRKFMLAEKK